MTDLKTLATTAGDAAFRNGWHDRFHALTNAGDTQGQTDWLAAKIGLIASEAHEAIEELRNGHGTREIYYALDGQAAYPAKCGSRTEWSDIPDGSGRPVWSGQVAKPEGVPVELADIIIRTLDLVDLLGIDIQLAINLKLAYNATRGQHHGGKKL